MLNDSERREISTADQNYTSVRLNLMKQSLNEQQLRVIKDPHEGVVIAFQRNSWILLFTHLIHHLLSTSLIIISTKLCRTLYGNIL